MGCGCGDREPTGRMGTLLRPVSGRQVGGREMDRVASKVSAPGAVAARRLGGLPLSSKGWIPQLPAAGSWLRPSGLPLPATGLAVGGGRPRCGNTDPSALAVGLFHAVTEGRLERGQRPDRAWAGAELRAVASCPTCDHGDPLDVRGASIDRIGRTIQGEGRVARGRATPSVGPPRGWSPDLRAVGMVEREHSSGPVIPDDDPRPEPGGGGSAEASAMPCTGSRVIVPNELETLADRCWISLGDDPYGVELRAYVPSDYVPTRSRTDMKRAFLPEWVARCTPTGTEWAMADRCIDYDSDPVPGLYWHDGLGFYHGALMHAVLTLYGYAGKATSWTRMAESCKLDADKIEERIETKRRWIRSKSGFCPDHSGTLTIDGRGQVWAAKEDAGWNAFGFDRVYLCAKWYKVEAALADYYLWWAHRLYSWCMDGHGTLRDYWIGAMCARAALAEIVEIAADILHELGHVEGSLYHCAATADEVVLGLDADDLTWLLGSLGGFWGLLIAWLSPSTSGEAHDCCQYGLDMHFRVRMWAELGLPRAHLWGGQSVDNSGKRFELAAGSELYSLHAAGEPNCWPSARSREMVTSHVDQFLIVGSPGNIQWTIPTDCSTDPAHPSGGFAW